MPAPELYRDAARQLAICNACRYCEGYCAVFPAIEIRGSFVTADVKYLANLCHDCRSCLSACMYAPPHEFAVNIPQLLAAVRLETYADSAHPRVLAPVLSADSRGFLAGSAVGAVALTVLAALLGDPQALIAAPIGEGSFYRILPYGVMVIAFLLLGGVALVAMAASFVSFSREIRGQLPGSGRSAVMRALRDAMVVRYLGGGDDDGCRYPNEVPSNIRRIMHGFVFYGFLSAFAATVAAAVMQDALGMLPPYALVSVPVVLGSSGGLAMTVGAAGLLEMKRRADARPGIARMESWDNALLVSIIIVSLTGMALLAVRDTAALGPMMLIHLGSVAMFFAMMPYGKFVHWVYRTSSLVRFRQEQQSSPHA